MGHYQWPCEIEELIKERFELQLSSRFSDMLRRCRNKAIKVVQNTGVTVGNDYSLLIPHNPTWLKQEYWKPLLQRWSTEEWQKKSKLGKQNKGKFVGGKHTLGSVSYVTAWEDLAAILRRTPTPREFFIYTHTRKGTRPWDHLSEEGASFDNNLDIDELSVDGGINGPVVGGSEAGNSDAGNSGSQGSHVDELAWVDERARQHLEIYQRLMIDEYGENLENHPLLDERLWVKAAGGKKKGRTYCANKSIDPFFVLTGKPSQSSNVGSHYLHPTEAERLLEMEKKERERERMEREQEKENDREELAKVRDEFENYKSSTNAKLEELFAKFKTPPSPPPPS